MRTVLAAVVVSACAWGAIGDNAPSVPAGYVMSHPRLPYPDDTYLDTIWAARAAGAAYIWTEATNWNSASPGTLIQFRHLLLAYLAEKRKSGPNTAIFLAKIQAMGAAPGTWAGNYWLYLGLAIAYDWTYADLGSAVQGQIRTNLYDAMTHYENAFTGSSPYNDQFYITGSSQCLHLIYSLAVYPDDAGNSLPHLRWSMDVFVNMLFPTWKQIMGNEGFNAGTSAGDPTNGGGWQESWEYINQAEGMMQWYVPYLLTWKTATGDSTLFTREPWIKDIGYQLLYKLQPDWNMVTVGQTSRPYLAPEYSATVAGGGAGLGSIEGLAAIYNDSLLRGWARLLDWQGATPNGYEPSAWPFYTPDSATNTASARSIAAKSKDFPGWGYISMRTGWTEDDTMVTIRYGDEWWSHPVGDTGAFTIFNRGPLAIRSGTYRSGSASPHFEGYAIQSIAHNLPLVYDPADIYNDENYGMCSHVNTNCSSSAWDINVPVPNDGGQRRTGSGYGNWSTMGSLQNSPVDPANWYRAREYYHKGNLAGYAVGAGNSYTYASVDTTWAYNNLFSHVTHSGAWNPRNANSSNRTYRVQRAGRQFVFIPNGTAAFLIVQDLIVKSNASFQTKDLIHSVNQPSITANQFTILRTETITNSGASGTWPNYWANANLGSDKLTHCPTSCASSTQYVFNGKLVGYATWPGTVSLGTVGGDGHEFEITDSNGTKNWNECMIAQCESWNASFASNTSGPFAITAGTNDTLSITIDSGSPQTIPLTSGAARTCAQVIADINALLTGGSASCEGFGADKVALRSNLNAQNTSKVIINAANANATLGLTAGTYVGGFYEEGFAAIGNFMHPARSNTIGGNHPGAWRIEERIPTGSLTDIYTNVYWITNNSDTNTISVAPTTTDDGAGNLVTTFTWHNTSTGNDCAYTVTLSKLAFAGGAITALGSGCPVVIN